MRTLVTASLAALVLSAGLVAQTYPPPFPRTGATNILENDRVAVWDVTWPKGHPTLLHRHPYDMTGVYLAPGDRLITEVNGTKRPVSTKAGGIVWQFKGLTHTEEGTSEPSLHAIMIELKKADSYGTDASPDLRPAFPRDTATQLLENDRVRVFENVWPLHQKGPLHKHVRDAVVVWIAGGTLRSTSRTGAQTDTDVKAFTATFGNRGNEHSEEATAGPPRAYVFELK
jgi:hypothetical protein